MKWTRNEWAEIIGSFGAAAARWRLRPLFIAGRTPPDQQNSPDRRARFWSWPRIVVGFGGIVGFFSKRSSQLGTNTTILTLAVIVILAW